MNQELTATSAPGNPPWGPEQRAAITEAQFAILTQATESTEVRYRQGRGGRKFPYTDAAYVIRTLNLAFNWNWDFVVDNEDVFYLNERPFEVKCRGRLTVRMGGNEITKTQFGCQPIEFLQDKGPNGPNQTPVSIGDAFKGAASDALKKCASLLGVALDLYDSDSDINTGKQPHPSGHSQGSQPVKPVRVDPIPQAPAAKPPNGDKKPIDPMTRYWQEVKAAGLERPKGLEILAAANNDPSRAVDVLLGMTQV